MYILTKTYVADNNYNFSLFVSTVIVSISMYFFLQNYKQTITIHLPVVKSPNVVSVVLTKAPVMQEKKKVVPKPKPKKIKKITPKKRKKIVPLKKISKPKPIVKTKKAVAKKIVYAPVQEIQKSEPEPVEEVAVAVKQVQLPIFDAAKKDEFITGLYHILNKNKKYPKMAKRRHLEGIAHIKFKLLKNGNLIHAKVNRSCGHSILDKAALKLVANIKHYKPIPDVVSLSALDLNIPIKYSR